MSSSRSKTIARALSLGAASAALAYGALWGYRNRRLFTVSDITTGESFDYPELRAHVYFTTPESALDAARQAIGSLPGFRIVQHDPSQSQIVAEAETQIGRFVDDLIVSARPLGSRHIRVVIRSRSRAGRGDLGENARHIRLLQEAMDKLLVGG